MNRKIFIGIIFIFIIFCLALIFLITHEQVHKQISIYHNCIDYEISINYFLVNGYFVCNEYSLYDNTTILQEKKLHSWNEIIGYPVGLIYVSGIFICLLFIYIYIFKNEE